MEEWKEVQMSDIIEEISMGPFGSDIKRECYVDDGVPYLNGSNVQGIKLGEKSFIYVSEEKAKSLKKSIAHRGDLIVTHRGTLGQIVYVPDDSKYNEYLISNSQFRITLKKDIVSPVFLAYYFHSREGQNKILANSSQVGVPALGRPTSTFRQIAIKIPSLQKQNKIVSLLKSLDDKIENNRKINENLEQQAQALFKSWFVDFEPFRDQPFVESELGMIPEGWRVDVYDSIIKDIIPGDWGKDKEEGNYTHKVACVRGCDFQDIKNGLRGKTPERYILEKNYAAKRFQDHDVLVEISGGTPTISTGRVCPISQKLIELYDSDIVCTNFCKVIRPMKGYGAFLYYSWLYKFNNKVMFGYENGTSV
jgi:type I restriction enzyme S subunit